MSGRKNNRHVSFDGTPSFVAIRLARCWAEGMSKMDLDWVYDWTPGPSYGSRRPTTWPEKRAAVADQLPRAKVESTAMQERKARAARNEIKHADELSRLRQERYLLENKPWGVNIRPEQDRIDGAIRELLAAE